MDPRSEVLLRQAEFFNDNVLLAGITHDGLLNKLSSSQAWVWLANEAQALSAQYNDRVHVGISAPTQNYQAGVLFLPKSKELTYYLLEALAACLEPGHFLYLVGEKKAGIESAAKQLATFGKTIKIDNARHCQLWQCQLINTPPRPNLLNFACTYQVQNCIITSLAGVFSQSHLDKGTRLLIQHLDNLPLGNMLDFGCGSGVLGCCLKQQYPDATVYLQDVDAFAIASAELTLQKNNLTATTLLADGINNAPSKLTAIVSNPPFHQGIQTNYQATEELLAKAIDHLIIGGELRIVANSFLKYQPLITNSFGNCQILAEADGFRIYSAIKYS